MRSADPELSEPRAEHRHGSGPRRFRWPWLVLGALALGAPAGAATEAQTLPPVRPAGPSSSSHAGLINAVDEITQKVSALRGLPAKGRFQRGVLSRTEIGQKLRERVTKDYSHEEVRVEAAVLKRLGLLPVAADYEQLLLDLLTEQVAGFYDPHVKTLYVADWLPLEMQRPALAHEIEHALQDQYFDLTRFTRPLKEDTDRQLARSAVLEGDGTAVMLEFAANGMGLESPKVPELVARLGKQMLQLSLGSSPALQSAPPLLRETLVFPYASGLEFVAALRTNETWRRIDQVFADPPDSTEQILHPVKYLQRERPTVIEPATPPPALGTRTEIRRDVLGELLHKVWFQTQTSDSQATEAAQGWGGDRLVAYARPGDALPAILWMSSWDTDTDAAEAEQAGKRALYGLSGALASAKPSSSHRQSHDKAVPSTPKLTPFEPAVYKDTRSPEISHSLRRKGRIILVLSGVPSDREAAIASEVFATWKVKPATAAPLPEPAPSPTPSPAVPARPRATP